MTYPGTYQEERIYSANHESVIRVHPFDGDQEIPPGLEIMCDSGDEATVVPLDLDGVIKLRRALQRYEVARKRSRP